MLSCIFCPSLFAMCSDVIADRKKTRSPLKFRRNRQYFALSAWCECDCAVFGRQTAWIRSGTSTQLTNERRPSDQNWKWRFQRIRLSHASNIRWLIYDFCMLPSSVDKAQQEQKVTNNFSPFCWNSFTYSYALPHYSLPEASQPHHSAHRRW